MSLIVNQIIMRRIHDTPVLLIISICILYSFTLHAQTDPGVDFDLQGFIDQKIIEGETNIVIPPGRYRVPSNGSYHMALNNLNDITIVADSVEMICTETIQAIQINNCNNLRLQGLTIDYDPLPFTQGVIVDMSTDKRILTAEIIDGYSTTIRGNKLEIFDSISGELVTSTYYGITYEVDEENRRVLITKPSNIQVANSFEEIGDIVVLDSENTRHIPHGIVPKGCTNLVLEDIMLYSGTTFGYFETNCSGTQYINCRADRRPLETEIAERGLRRMRSINADGFHSKHATVGPKYIGCIARYNGDDGIAVNGHYHIILSSAGDKLIVVGKQGNVPNLVPGDVAELVSYTGERIDDATIEAIVTGPALSGEEKQFLQNQTFSGSVGTTAQASNVYIVTIDRTVDLPMGSLIASANRIGNNFEVRDCIIGPNRSRGILVKASDGVITGNTLTRNWGQAIKLAPEYSWLEAGSGSNIVISDNQITECHDAAIAVYANGGNGKTAPSGAHKNITITGNSISGSANPAIALTSIRGLVLEDNTITDPDNSLLVPWILNNFGRNTDPSREIYLENVVMEPVSIQDKTRKYALDVRINQNPCSDQLILELTEPADAMYTIYNILGKKVFSSSTGKQSVINTSNWNTGWYILAIHGLAPVKLLKK